MKILFLLSLLTLALSCLAGENIDAKDSRIKIRGTQYINPTENGLQFQRHSEEVLQGPRKELGINPDKARNNSGVVLAFETDSATLQASFNIVTANYMGARFGVFENGELILDEKFTAKEKIATLHIQKKEAGTSLIEITLPSFASVEFTGLELDNGATLNVTKTKPNKTYIALGDSISHGVGQDGSTHLTWPYLLSKKLDAELFNLAVGGGKISVPIADMLKDWEHIDLITVLIGYNDLHFDGKTPEAYKSKYNELLATIRSHHPDTKIVCISPLYTKKPVSEKTGARIEQFRSALIDLIRSRQEAGDTQLFSISGESVSSAKNLRINQPQDPVHLSIEGAKLLADALVQEINASN